MRVLSSTEIAARTCLAAAVACAVVIVVEGFPTGSHSPSTALYTGAGDGSISSCVARDYTTVRAVDIAWQVTNHDSKPHDYKAFIDAASGFEKEVDFNGLAPQFTKADATTIWVSRVNGSWPVVKCSIIAVAS